MNTKAEILRALRGVSATLVTGATDPVTITMQCTHAHNMLEAVAYSIEIHLTDKPKRDEVKDNV